MQVLGAVSLLRSYLVVSYPKGQQPTDAPRTFIGDEASLYQRVYFVQGYRSGRHCEREYEESEDFCTEDGKTRAIDVEDDEPPTPENGKEIQVTKDDVERANGVHYDVHYDGANDVRSPTILPNSSATIKVESHTAEQLKRRLSEVSISIPPRWIPLTLIVV